MNSIPLITILLAGQYVPVTTNATKRDAAKDIDAAILEAQITGKHILLVVGGDWLSWCHNTGQLLQVQSETHGTARPE